MKLKTHCPVHFALEHVGDRWSLLVIRDLMFSGKRYYNEFMEGGEGISTSVLGDKLKALQESGVISSARDKVKKSKVRYSLTEKGIALLPLLVDMILWSSIYDRESTADSEFVVEARRNRRQFLGEQWARLRQEHLPS